MKNNNKKLNKNEKLTEIKVYLYPSDKKKIKFIMERYPEIQSRSEIFRELLNCQYNMEIDDYEQEKQEKIKKLISSIDDFFLKYKIDDLLDWDGEKYYLRNGFDEKLTDEEFEKRKTELIEISDVALKLIKEEVIEDADYNYLLHEQWKSSRKENQN